MRIRRPPSSEIPTPAQEGGAPLSGFAAVVSAEWKYVVDVARRNGVPSRHCEDVALEVFLRFEKHAGTITAPGAVRSWLRTTAMHVSQEHLTHKFARHETLADPDLLEPPGFAPSPEEGFSAEQTYQALLVHVEALEPDRRTVFRAYAIDDVPMSTIAEQLGIPEATAYNRLRLARLDLKDALERARITEDRKLGKRASDATSGNPSRVTSGDRPRVTSGNRSRVAVPFGPLPAEQANRVTKVIRELFAVLARSLRSVAVPSASVVLAGVASPPAAPQFDGDAGPPHVAQAVTAPAVESAVDSPFREDVGPGVADTRIPVDSMGEGLVMPAPATKARDGASRDPAISPRPRKGVSPGDAALLIHRSRIRALLAKTHAAQYHQGEAPAPPP